MEYLKIALMIVGPYIAYAIFIKWLENEQDIELSKFIKSLIFVTIDILIFMIFS